MLGRASARPDVPFFWSQHHDVTIGYVGHAERFDAAEVHGDLAAGDAHVVYRDGGRIAAVATLGRDRLALEVEAAMERADDAAVRGRRRRPELPVPQRARYDPRMRSSAARDAGVASRSEPETSATWLSRTWTAPSIRTPFSKASQ